MDVEIKAYVTAKGGVVVMNGPFPRDEAEQVKRLCNLAPRMLRALERVEEYVERAAHRCEEDARDYLDELRLVLTLARGE